MKVGIATVGLGNHYPQLVARMLQRFDAVSPGYNVQAWVNTTPPGTPFTFVDSYNYTAYAAKPFAMHALQFDGCDIAILLDAAFYPVRDIKPLIDHIEEVGYYFCNNEFKVGEWCSDACMKEFGLTREALWQIPELSSYCVGLDLRRGECKQLLAQWRSAAYNQRMIAGRHTAGGVGRNHGFVSDDPAVKGHRHDQTVLSIIAYQFGMQELVKRPKLTAYAAMEWNEENHALHPNEETVLVNWGQLNVRFDE